MTTLDQLGNRIKSASDLQTVVRVMKSLSAVSIGHCQRASRSLREYQAVVDRSLQVALMEGHSRLADPGSLGEAGILIVMGSDRGLCGRFNEVVIRKATECISDMVAESQQLRIVVVGDRSAQLLEATGRQVDSVIQQASSVEGIGQTVESIIRRIDQWQVEFNVEQVDLVHGLATERGTAEGRLERLLPIAPGILENLRSRDWPSNQIPAIIGDPDTTLSTLSSERLYIAIMRAAAESLTAEHTARLSAMQAAEKNIAETLEGLAADYRRQRQGAITEELMDIVSAYLSSCAQD